MDTKTALLLEASGLVTKAYETGWRDALNQKSSSGREPASDYTALASLEDKILLCLRTHYIEFSNLELAKKIGVPVDSILGDNLGRLAEHHKIICDHKGRWRYNWDLYLNR